MLNKYIGWMRADWHRAVQCGADCALKRGEQLFYSGEYGSARSGGNQEFIDGLLKAADRIFKEGGM